MYQQMEKVPRRYIYPIDESQRNKNNYKSASEQLGGDELSSKVFWDK